MNGGELKVWDEVRIIKGGLKGEAGCVVGTTDLNMDHRIIVHRRNPRARDKIMGFYRDELVLLKGGEEYGQFESFDPKKFAAGTQF